jgi:ABC-type transport system involved in multi-copper enzyme maturation permease subunit
MVPWMAPWYTSYVLVFNMLVGPVFAAGTVTSERERQTLELLLTTTVSPWQILSGKLFSSLRISSVLTSFLVWPLLLSCLLPPWTYWDDMLTMFGYVAIIVLTSLTTTTLATFCSVIFRKTSVAMMTSYLVLMVLFAMPVAVDWFARLFFKGAAATEVIAQFTLTSPFSAAFALPLDTGQSTAQVVQSAGNWPVFLGFLVFYALVDFTLLRSMIWLFNVRWRVRY